MQNVCADKPGIDLILKLPQRESVLALEAFSLKESMSNSVSKLEDCEDGRD